MRFREELERGHHILSNEALDGRAVQYKKDMFQQSSRPTQAWTNLGPPPPKPVEEAEQAKEEGPQEAAKASDVGSKRSQHPVISTRSQKPAEAPKSQASQIPRSQASQASKPPTQRSNAAAPAVVASQRSAKSQAPASEPKQASAAASRAASNAPKSNQ